MCVRMNLSLEEQRRRGLEGRNETLHPTSWVGRHLTRRISPYVTWVFLRLGLSANQCTVLRLVFVAGIAAMFAMPGVSWWIPAVFGRYGTIVLDAVDGELSRIRGTSSPEGTYFDELASFVATALIPAGMTCGLYRALGGLHVIAIGLAATVGMMLTVTHQPLVRAVAREWGIRSATRGRGTDAVSAFVSKGRRAATFFLLMPGVQYLPHVLAASVLDAFIAPFPLFGMTFNVRLLWMGLLALGTLCAAVVRSAITMRHGLRAQL
jgi:phosphatidylglycerophosphate synthase